MNRRKDFQKILHHEQPSRLMIDFGGNPLSTMEGRSMEYLLDFLGFEHEPLRGPVLFGKTRRMDERIQKHYDTDTRSVGYILTPPHSLFQMHSETDYTDEWGIRRRFTGLYWEAINAPLKDATLDELECYPWPDPDSIPEQELEVIGRDAQRLHEETDYVICAEHPVYGIFELGCWMCGFDDFLYRMLAEPEFVQRFFSIILDYQKKVIARYYKHVGPFIDFTSSGDDFATQTSLFVSPALFQESILPFFKERVQYTKAFTSAAFLHHSCGSVHPLIPCLAEAGVDILNPIQPLASGMQPKRLKEEYGDIITFHGGIDTQDILPFGTQASIEQTVKETIAILNQKGGYIFAAAHNIQEDVPPKNLDIMLKAARRFGG